MAGNRPRLAYLLGRYPAISNLFIQREVRALRGDGMEIETISVRPPLRDHLISPVDREEAERTYKILPPRPLDLLRAHVAALTGSPGAYLLTLLAALGGGPPGLRGPLWQLFYFGEAMLAWHLCERKGLRHLHAHFGNVAPDVAMLVAHFGRRHDGPGSWSWSFTMHGPDEFWDVSRHRLARKVASADLVVCISHFARSQLMAISDERHWGKLRVVHCGIDPGEFQPEGGGGADGGLSVLCVGRLIKLKGQAILLRAVAEAARSRPDIEVTFVGYGEARAELERLARELGIEERVTFAGAAGSHQLRDLYARADVFCLPSFGEGVPIVLMEAMAMRLPVVTTHIAGIPELVEHDVNGLLLPPGRVDALAAALTRLAADPQLRARMGEAGRRRVEAEFESGACARELRELLVELPGVV